MFSDNEPSCLSAHLSFSVINVKEDSFLMVHITHVAGKFLPRNNLHLLSSVCLCGLFHSGVIYCSTISLALISHSSDWDVIFFLGMSATWKLKVFVAQRGTFTALPFTPFYFCLPASLCSSGEAFIYLQLPNMWRFSALYYLKNTRCKTFLKTLNCKDFLDEFWIELNTLLKKYIQNASPNVCQILQN